MELLNWINLRFCAFKIEACLENAQKMCKVFFLLLKDWFLLEKVDLHDFLISFKKVISEQSAMTLKSETNDKVHLGYKMR